MVCHDYTASGIRDFLFCLHAPAGSTVRQGGHAYVSIHTAEHPDKVQTRGAQHRTLERDNGHHAALERLARKWMARSIPQNFA